jgi:prepilin-type N-terminal cleavage/methylation domain-containing protein
MGEIKIMVRKDRKSKYAFTLVEVMVTAVLITVALVGLYQGISAMDNARAYAVKSDLLQRLAIEKLSDVSLLQDPSSNGGSGDFSDRGYPNITWSLTEASTNVTNLDDVSVTVTEGKQAQSVSTQMYVAPVGTSTGAATSGGG